MRIRLEHLGKLHVGNLFKHLPRVGVPAMGRPCHPGIDRPDLVQCLRLDDEQDGSILFWGVDFVINVLKCNLVVAAPQWGEEDKAKNPKDTGELRHSTSLLKDGNSDGGV